jgi:hypothetical protein
MPLARVSFWSAIQSSESEGGASMCRYLPYNMGVVDRALRAFVVAPAAVIAALVIGVPSILGLVLLAVATLALVTGAIGVCPGYVPFGIDTRGRAHGGLLPD